MTFKFKNVYITISVYFAATITFSLLFFSDFNVLPTLICCILHEIGHFIMIYICHGKVRKITLGAYGMRIDTIRTLKISPKKEIFISLAGPFVNIIIALVGLLFKDNLLIKTNLGLCFFNLLPAGKTDGHTALYNLLILKFDRNKAERIIGKIAVIFLVIIYLFGILILIKTKYNFSLLAVAVYITIINAMKS